MEHDFIWNEKQVIKSYQIGPNSDIKITAISEIFQEAAGNHATFRKFDIHQMMQSGRVWVMSRLKFEIERLPHWGEEVSIDTWIKEVKGSTSYRDFIIYDNKDNVLVKGTSLWYGIDIKTRRPTDIEDLKAVAPLRADFSAIDEIGRLSLNKEDGFKTERTAQYSDLDPVRHVNNVKYVEWMLDSLPADILMKYQPESITINFLSETNLGDMMDIETVQTQIDKKINFNTCIKHQSNDKLSCILKSTWKEKINSPMNDMAMFMN